MQTFILTGLVLWIKLKLKFPQLVYAADNSTPLPACLPFCLTSGQSPIVVNSKQWEMVENTTIRKTKKRNGVVIKFGRRRFFTDIINK